MYKGDLGRFTFYKGKREDLLEGIIGSVRRKERKFIITANPEIISHSFNDDSFEEVLDSADEIVADGIGIIWAEKLWKRTVPLHFPGIEIMQEIFDKDNVEKIKIFLLGAQEETLLKAVNVIEREYPNVIISGHQHGFFEDNDVVLRKIQESQPDFVFVALGSPLQEKWIYNNIHEFEKGIFIGVGGSLDVFSGEVKRAPKVLRQLHLEWLYRISTHPHRSKKVKSLLTFSTNILSTKLLNTFTSNKIPKIQTRDPQ